jgi:hypothetical protein
LGVFLGQQAWLLVVVPRPMRRNLQALVATSQLQVAQQEWALLATVVMTPFW